MSYTVLARKHRSRTFDELVGQQAVTTTLRNAIAHDRVHHGYLFCGTRGVGKTSMARILAKALNCLAFDKPTTDPCGKCDSCVAVASGDDVDVIEIDGASNAGVGDIRDLRNNTAYRPARARFKIYIIDEVHMLSTEAFNALLKTLEEPPEHVKFIFATTEPQKVPATILSRVQRFDFKSISAKEIADQLRRICKTEDVPAEDAAVQRIARLANGSMRDALSLLDQVLSMGRGEVTARVVDELVPATHDERLARLIDRLAENDAAGALAVADESLGQGHALDYWCTLLIAQLRDLMLLRVCGPDADLVDVPGALRKAVAEQSRKFDPGAYVYMITLLEELRRSVKYSGSGRALIDAAVVRLAEASQFSSIESLLTGLDGDAARGPAPRQAPAPRAAAIPAASVAPGGDAASKKKVAPATPSGDADAPPDDPVRPATHPAAMAAPVPQRPESTAAVVSRRDFSPPQRPAAPIPPPRRVTQADIKAARAEPVVRAALEVFNGEIVDVRRSAAGGVPAPSRRTEDSAAAESESIEPDTNAAELPADYVDQNA